METTALATLGERVHDSLAIVLAVLDAEHAEGAEDDAEGAEDDAEGAEDDDRPDVSPDVPDALPEASNPFGLR